MTPPVPPDSALRDAVTRVAAMIHLDEAMAAAAFAELIGGGAPPELAAEFLLGLRAKGESPDEIAGAVRALRQSMRTVAHEAPHLLVDTCGTGGGKVSTINLSTAAAFVAAGAGVPIAKHGNRSFTSRSGSADVLEALGVSIALDPEGAAAVLATVGIVFLFAPTYHPAMRHVAPIRRELGVPTIMNLVGPLANPAGALRQVVGVADARHAPGISQALLQLGAHHALVVHAEIGMDEVSPVGTSVVWEIRDGVVSTWTLDPAELGLETANLDGLAGGEPSENAERIVALFEAPAAAAPALRSAVLLNAAAAIHVGGVVPSWTEAVDRARDSLESGKSRDRLESLRRAAPH